LNGNAKEIKTITDLCSDFYIPEASSKFFILCNMLWIFYAAYIFFKKKRYFPETMIVSIIYFCIVDFMLLIMDSSNAEKSIAGILSGLIWIRYFCVSKRVKNTFVH